MHDVLYLDRYTAVRSPGICGRASTGCMAAILSDRAVTVYDSLSQYTAPTDVSSRGNFSAQSLKCLLPHFFFCLSALPSVDWNQYIDVMKEKERMWQE